MNCMHQFAFHEYLFKEKMSLLSVYGFSFVRGKGQFTIYGGGWAGENEGVGARSIQGTKRGGYHEIHKQMWLCTSQAFVDCSTICTMMLLLNIKIRLGKGYVLFQIKLRGIISFFHLNDSNKLVKG